MPDNNLECHDAGILLYGALPGSGTEKAAQKGDEAKMKRIVLELGEKEAEKLRRFMQEEHDHIIVVQAEDVLHQKTIKTKIKEVALTLTGIMLAGMVFTAGVWLTAAILSLVS